MFSKFFKSKEPQETQKKQLHPDPATNALLLEISARKKENPMIGVIIGAKEVSHRIIEAMKTEKGVHVESLLALLGALAGFTCQFSVLETLAKENRAPQGQELLVVRGKNNKNYYIGGLINACLLEGQYSIWSLTAGELKALDCNNLPDAEQIMKHVLATLGSDEFGKLALPEGHNISDTLDNYVRNIWPAMMPTVRLFCETSSELPILYGLAIQEVLRMAKDSGVIELKLAGEIVMEAAIAMAKIDPADVGLGGMRR